jgi:hypothetical protein
MKAGANGMKSNAREPEPVAEEPLVVTLKGKEGETTELWADLVEFVLAARRRARRRADEDNPGNAA